MSIPNIMNINPDLDIDKVRQIMFYRITMKPEYIILRGYNPVTLNMLMMS